MTWEDEAACKDKTDLFFIDGFPGPWMWDAARQICRACPVLEECEQYALEEFDRDYSHIASGFIAGMTPRQRKTRRAQLRETAA